MFYQKMKLKFSRYLCFVNRNSFTQYCQKFPKNQLGSSLLLNITIKLLLKLKMRREKKFCFIMMD